MVAESRWADSQGLGTHVMFTLLQQAWMAARGAQCQVLWSQARRELEVQMVVPLEDLWSGAHELELMPSCSWASPLGSQAAPSPRGARSGLAVAGDRSRVEASVTDLCLQLTGAQWAGGVPC